MEITLPNSQGNQSFRSVAGKRSNGRAVYLGDPRLALLGRSPVGVEKSALTTPCPVAAGSVFSGKVQTKANRVNYAAHAGVLKGAAGSASGSWQTRQAQRRQDDLPVAPAGMPILLKVDPNFDLEILREKFGFEIVSEQEDGFVIVASEDLQLTELVNMINDFATNTYGSATIASIHKLFDDPSQEERLKRILSESLYQAWPTIKDDRKYVVDVGVGGLGAREIPEYPNRGKRDSDADWARKEADWAKARADAYQAWDDVKAQREEEVARFIGFYEGRIINIIDDQAVDAVELPDSFTVRVELIGKGLRDLVINYSYIFEVVEPEDIELPQRAASPEEAPRPDVTLLPPPIEAPTVCVIDSGIQEEHILSTSRMSKFCELRRN